ncbi:hypothetical protein QBC39DRAFT_371629 [Podospora conica]|nr:hypothetical protein QBC39DRAFT_371629 [Schizothecium conicum]
MSPAERANLLPLFTGAKVDIKSLEKAIQYLSDYASILANVPEEHRVDFLETSQQMLAHHTSILDDDKSDKVSDGGHSDTTETVRADNDPGLHRPRRGIALKGLKGILGSLNLDKEKRMLADYQGAMNLKLRLDHTSSGSSLVLEDLRRKAFSLIANHTIMVTEQSSPKPMKLIPEKAHLIMKLFFKEMIDPVGQRAMNIVRAYHNQGISKKAAERHRRHGPQGQANLMSSLYGELSILANTDPWRGSPQPPGPPQPPKGRGCTCGFRTGVMNGCDP